MYVSLSGVMFVRPVPLLLVVTSIEVAPEPLLFAVCAGSAPYKQQTDRSVSNLWEQCWIFFFSFVVLMQNYQILEDYPKNF